MTNLCKELLPQYIRTSEELAKDRLLADRACFMCYLWTDAAKDRDNYKQYYEYYQEQAREQKGNK